jgi:hypothetical protein
MDSVFLRDQNIEISQLLILVPQGAEYQAVLATIKKIAHSPVILAIPVGNLAVT